MSGQHSSHSDISWEYLAATPALLNSWWIYYFLLNYSLERSNPIQQLKGFVELWFEELYFSGEFIFGDKWSSMIILLRSSRICVSMIKMLFNGNYVTSVLSIFVWIKNKLKYKTSGLLLEKLLVLVNFLKKVIRKRSLPSREEKCYS